MKLDAAGLSEVGLVRGNNEDAWQADDRVAAVSDGVGGRPAGEVASALAVHVFCELARHEVDLARAAQAASDVVRATGSANSLFTGMCCTLTAVSVRGDRAVLTHVGDSKAWLVRGDGARQVSEDHTLVAQLVRAGELTTAEAATDPRRHRILQAVGAPAALEPQVLELDARPGDRVVLATDGLDYADRAVVDGLLVATCAPAELAGLLVAAAYEAGAPDNVTAVVADLLA